MHIKLVLLYYKTFLRVAVATANLIDYDWSTIENVGSDSLGDGPG